MPDRNNTNRPEIHLTTFSIVMQSPQNSLTASDAERESAGRSDGDILASNKEEPLFADGVIWMQNAKAPRKR